MRRAVTPCPNSPEQTLGLHAFPERQAQRSKGRARPPPARGGRMRDVGAKGPRTASPPARPPACLPVPRWRLHPLPLPLDPACRPPSLRPRARRPAREMSALMAPACTVVARVRCMRGERKEARGERGKGLPGSPLKPPPLPPLLHYALEEERSGECGLCVPLPPPLDGPEVGGTTIQLPKGRVGASARFSSWPSLPRVRDSSPARPPPSEARGRVARTRAPPTCLARSRPPPPPSRAKGHVSPPSFPPIPMPGEGVGGTQLLQQPGAERGTGPQRPAWTADDASGGPSHWRGTALCRGGGGGGLEGGGRGGEGQTR